MAVEIEFQNKTIPMDANMQAELEKLQAEGWQIVPGTTPLALYCLHRQRPGGVVGGLNIDDSQVHVIRDGKKVTN